MANTNLITTTLPTDEYDLYHTYDWRARGAHQGTYELAVKATADGAVAWDTIEFQILRGETDLEVTRSITRAGPAFNIRLDIYNDGTLTANLDYLYDALQGFHPVEKATANYSVEGDYDPWLLESEVYIYLFSTGSIYYPLPPGDTLRIQYQAVPALYPDQDMDWYEIGQDPLLPPSGDTYRMTTTASSVLLFFMWVSSFAGLPGLARSFEAKTTIHEFSNIRMRAFAISVHGQRISHSPPTAQTRCGTR